MKVKVVHNETGMVLIDEEAEIGDWVGYDESGSPAVSLSDTEQSGRPATYYPVPGFAVFSFSDSDGVRHNIERPFPCSFQAGGVADDPAKTLSFSISVE